MSQSHKPLIFETKRKYVSNILDNLTVKKTLFLEREMAPLAYPSTLIQLACLQVPLPKLYLERTYEDGGVQEHCFHNGNVIHAIQTFLDNKWCLDETPLKPEWAGMFARDMPRYISRRIEEGVIETFVIEQGQDSPMGVLMKKHIKLLERGSGYVISHDRYYSTY